jgi:ABC-2 type transport system ATP-binding protein
MPAKNTKRRRDEGYWLGCSHASLLHCFIASLLHCFIASLLHSMTFVILRIGLSPLPFTRHFSYAHTINKYEEHMPEKAILTIDQLHVHYEQLHAVDGLSLQINTGEIFGLLGPNGAGKTSTLACIEGLRKPTSGRVLVAGHDVTQEPLVVKKLLGVQLQKSALFEELTATELIELYAALYDTYPKRSEVIALLERFGLAQKAHARPGQLSGGQYQRLTLALALVHKPAILILDEPTTGLDPQARRGVWALIRSLQAEGCTILLTTHAMEEAQELCDRIGIMDEGKLVALGTPQALIGQYAPPLSPAEAARRQPNLEDVFLALTGRELLSVNEMA